MFSFPSASTAVASSTDYATTLFTEFLPFVWLLVGTVAAVVAIIYLRKVVAGSIKRVGGGKRGRRRRR